ncbi:RimK/LysX family protein [Sphingomicrobium sp. XHP0239]|uniref:ATP-dependent zinc protease family protein n=1 Tax=Sphingomicrobium maritimum TaxID=3133972 RepID=UPI0031CCC700
MTKGTVGWREWVALPALGVPAIKAKIDTGAKTSAIHAWRVHHFRNEGMEHLSFFLHPHQDDDEEVACLARLLDMREVTSSNGMRQRRFVIETDLEMGGSTYPIELTLTNRDDMGFRMLIGRQALRKRWLVDPAKSFLTRPDLNAEKEDE